LPPLSRLLPPAWSLGLAVLMLGAALGPGLVLSYDMVWVPDLALRPDSLGTGSALPRAVPSDAVVAVLDEVVPGALLQKLVLLGSLVGAGTGAAALVGGPLTARLVAVSIAQWNPFVVERLVIGHWPVLAGYAVLPWLLVAGRRLRASGRLPAAVPWLVLAGSLSATAGLATALVTLLACVRSGRTRTNLLVVALVTAVNLPWIVAGLLHAGAATADPAGARLFATSGEGLLPGPLAALSLGGIWNAEVVPGSRTGAAGLVFLVLVVVLACLGARRTLAAVDRWELRALAVAWGVGTGVALVSWAVPGALGWLGAHVPGGGLLRDGSRLLALSAPLTVVLVANGATVVRDRMPDRASRVIVAGTLAVLPVTVMPDAAFGASGALRAVQLPASYDAVRGAVAQAPQGDVVVLPFTSYRAPGWNGGRKVLDPVPRVVDRDSVANDELSVSGVVVEGEDPRAGDVRAALSEPTAAGRSAALTELDVSVAVVAEVPGQRSPAVAGEVLLERDGLTVVELAGAVQQRTQPAGWLVAMALAWAGWLLVPIVWILQIVSSSSQRPPNTA
jgi:hypothetical protein